MEEKRHKLLIATTNEGKLVELSDLLSSLPFQLLSLSALPDVEEVAETGETFAANAALKAAGYAEQASMLTLADDSGLEVAALGGRPGVHTARYGGPDTGFDRKMELLLEELAETGTSDRSARFVCAVAIAAPGGEILFSSEGICPGRIAAGARGRLGFGFDPIFIPEGMDRTFGELSVNTKQAISHRSRAFGQIKPFLCGFEAILT